MNGFKTLMLLAAMTALFMGLGYTLGGSGGALVALVAAAAMNLFTFWNADKIVLKMHKAREVAGSPATAFVGLVKQIGRASCRERVCQSVEVQVVSVSIQKKTKQ